MNDLFADESFEEKLELTPLVDVIFLLLLFFIMATTFIKPVVDVTLPSAESAAAPETRERELILAVGRDGRVLHEGAVLDMNGIDALLLAHAERPVSLQVDKDAPFEAFISVLDRIKLQGRENVAITTLPGRQRTP